MKNNYNTSQVTLTLNGRSVDPRSINIEGVDRKDSPDFSDAFIGEAQWMNDGTALNDEELIQLTDENGEMVNELANEQAWS